MREFNIYWKKKNSEKENITFIVAPDLETAYNKVFKFKGGKNKITIIGAQEINRGLSELIGDFIPYEE